MVDFWETALIKRPLPGYELLPVALTALNRRTECPMRYLWPLEKIDELPSL
jgi:hypothetical protein